MKKEKIALEALLRKIQSRRRQMLCRQLIQDFSSEFKTYPGSILKHQSWRGGYQNHVEEAMNIAVELYNTLDEKRPLAFSLSDALFTLFIHDLDKLLCYKKTKEGFVRIKRYEEIDVAEFLKKKYHYSLNTIERNAIQYIHGEGKDYHPTKRVMLPLAAFVHCCDIVSARIWHDKGRDAKKW